MMRKLIKLTIAGVMMFSITAVSYAAPKKSTPVILKMNNYYVAYTYPKEPYVDKQNRLILPLRSVSELLGAAVSYNNQTKTAEIKEGENIVQIQAGNKTAKVNGQNVEMDTKAVVEKGFLLVPARILFDSFSFKVTNENNVITLNDERLLKQGKLKYLSDDDRVGIARTADPNAFQPIEISYNVFVKNKVSLIDLTVTAKNSTGKDIPEGQEDLHTIVYFEHSSIMDADDSTVDIKDRPRPAVKKDAIIKKQLNAGGGTIIQPNDLQYILIAGRTFKPLNEG
ncbi:copper amine oxidase N-terminal domain-containing protein [Paenibacillus sp. MCAF9]|uniref:copper amine oxidase N-terminal domain-containing protein n=1 Tax=Paenibacillus sp. MCAF9 TaxID=3233046 RepID=UPI003F9D2048